VLSDSKIRKAKLGKKWDSGGLYVVVRPSGSRLFRMDYLLHGKRRTLSFGPWPITSLRRARQLRDEARDLLIQKIDPSATMRRAKLLAELSSGTTLRAVAEEWLSMIEDEGRADRTLKKARWLLRSLVFPMLGDVPIADITTPEILAVLRRVESKGHRETARRLRSTIARVFRFAIATGRATNDPTIALQGALRAPVVKHRSAIVEPKAVGALLKAIDGYQGHPATRYALRIAPHVFVRPGELRTAEWKEFDIENAVWKIPAEKAKMRRDHHVPLAKQVIDLLNELKGHTGKGRFLFPALGNAAKPMSDIALNDALRRLGYDSATMTAHGFRSTASTLLNESGKWSVDAIERQLAHAEKSAVRSAYDRGARWEERVAMMTWWSDYLDTLKAAAK
jgi:integrase